jgi:excisionase family DNA binding protein
MSVQPWLALPGFEEAVAHVVQATQPAVDEGFLDARGAAEYLGLTRKAVYALVERGRLPHRKPGGRLLFDKAALRAWVERGR